MKSFISILIHSTLAGIVMSHFCIPYPHSFYKCYYYIVRNHEACVIHSTPPIFWKGRVGVELRVGVGGRTTQMLPRSSDLRLMGNTPQKSLIFFTAQPACILKLGSRGGCPEGIETLDLFQVREGWTNHATSPSNTGWSGAGRAPVRFKYGRTLVPWSAHSTQ